MDADMAWSRCCRLKASLRARAPIIRAKFPIFRPRIFLWRNKRQESKARPSQTHRQGRKPKYPSPKKFLRTKCVPDIARARNEDCTRCYRVARTSIERGSQYTRPRYSSRHTNSIIYNERTSASFHPARVSSGSSTKRRQPGSVRIRGVSTDSECTDIDCLRTRTVGKYWLQKRVSDRTLISRETTLQTTVIHTR